MAALIGALRVSLSADTANFQQGMKRAQRQARSSSTAINKSLGIMKAGLAGLAAGLSVGLFVNAIKGALDYAGSLGEVAQQLGVTTRDLQVFRYAAGQVGVSQEQLETGLSKLTITLGRVAAGAKQPAAALNAIGVSVDQLRGKDTGQAFRIIADGLEKVKDRSQRAAVEMALFGRSGAMLDNLLSGGSKAINELALAAEELGIVLSDEQIAKADETADKLAALKTVLSARIAGIVADNADAILGLANALADLVGSIGSALRAWANFRAQMNAGLLELQGMEAAAARARGSAFVSGQNPTVPGRSVTIALAPAKQPKAPPATGANIGKFLGAGGGAKKSPRAKEDRSAERALSDAFRFDQEIRRAQMDVLRAMQDLSTDAVERYAISIQIKDAERSALDAELQYEVAIHRLTKGEQGLSEVQAAQLRAQYDRLDALERQKLIADENARAAEESARLDDLNLDLERDRLQSEAQLAETSAEQRNVQLRLLDLAYRQERARLEAVLADEQASYAAKEEARRRLANLNQTYGSDRQGVINGTRGPMEQFRAQFGDITEELEDLKVRGIMGAVDALTALTEGFGSFRDAALSAIKQVLAELIRLQLMKLAVGLMGGGAGGGSAFLGAPGAYEFGGGSVFGWAHGGGGIIGGRAGVDRNLLSLNGLPVARVSRGEMLTVTPDGKSMGGGTTINAPITINSPVTRQTATQLASQLNARIAQARVKGV